MTDLKLESSEEILYQTQNVERYKKNDKYTEIYEMYLTNQNLIYVYEKSNGLFSKTENVVEKLPLNEIKVARNKVQVFNVDDNDYGIGMQMFLNDGTHEHFIFEHKKEIQNWINLIEETIMNNYNLENVNKTTKEIDNKKYIYCVHCGERLAPNSKFCSSCGELTEKEQTDNKSSYDNNKNDVIEEKGKNSERKVVYDGEIHKCPNCGEVLKAFEVKCPSCGHELRDSKSSTAISEFANKISNIKSDEECAKLIRNFPIPNNKEDILEFMILAGSNISGEKSREVFEAWRVKFEQSYQKAKLTFENDKIFSKIQKIYDDTNQKIEKEKKVHNVLDLKRWLDKIMINPIFGIAVIGVTIYGIIRLISGNFAGIDIIFDAIILDVVYKKTNKKDRGGK